MADTRGLARYRNQPVFSGPLKSDARALVYDDRLANARREAQWRRGRNMPCMLDDISSRHCVALLDLRREIHGLRDEVR